MKKYFLLILLAFLNLNAQNNSILKYTKRNVECEDKWVVFPQSKDSTYIFGFIYIDSQAGLTFNYEGSFKIENDGKFILIEQKDIKHGLKVRLEPDDSKFAEVPEAKYSELKIKKIPDWLSVYKDGEGTIERLYRWGYLYNGYGECEKALTFLLEAEKKNPNFEGLQVEIAYAYNHLGKYELAELSLNKAIKFNSKDCYVLKELAYTYTKQKKYDKGVQILDKMKKTCSEETTYIIETAYNFALEYYLVKDKKNFLKWKEEVLKLSTKENVYTKNVVIMENELNK
ncbi:tetratricopeptide repeat protein [Flavobacterium urocaniciphilum]|uniref:Uncharacterized protein n=1 Tax=Flavobacterium urocaniciphilum TaxID=1299341 RepID=A0A1H9DUZ7_9FLAO|nr:hypothetical protein [Flavobacterium urocaniciphilum]SEQ17241.1 hypothetical protein SAMN05444005_10882 [Flavobacterium urocaniciphilum]